MVPALRLNSRPVRYLVTRLARAYGFLDPVAVLARMRGFAQPSEVAEPIELLRAGMLFHARGLVNTKAIQHNLDWVWPYWVERQFNPRDPSFIPRAFSFSHINLTHRNWTAVGLPGVPYYPIVDPRGLVTPMFDGWSLDFWLVPADGRPVCFPSKLDAFEQELRCDGNLSVRSVARCDELAIESEVFMCLEDGKPSCCIRVEATGPSDALLAVALRPYNPEGVSIVERVAVLPDRKGWRINDRHPVLFDRRPIHHLLSTYEHGDVSLRLKEEGGHAEVICPVNLATAVALFPLSESPVLSLRAPIFDELETRRRPKPVSTQTWGDAMAGLARLKLNDAKVSRLFEQALAGVVLHTPDEVYPGPYTYKRFWFRDAVFVLNALLSLGGVERTRVAMNHFAPRQRRDGYFLSQEGEWDSNGEALWFYHRFCRLTGEAPPSSWLDAVQRGARWISRKRLPKHPARPEAGLLPAGFSAEHLGPNDHYYWDDFWGVAGLRAAAGLLSTHDPAFALRCDEEASEFLETILASIPQGPHRRFPGAIPASPRRRMDSGAVGSLVADYPLQLLPAGDPAMTGTADFLTKHCLHQGGFFQDMIHSGINAYLTLHLAQVRLRAGDPGAAWALIDRVAELASPTGQWPEAIHPATLGGCMGDGQHIWAASEWLMMVRNLFVREEGDTLVLGAGIKPEWLRNADASFGPTLTPFGEVSVRFSGRAGGIEASLEGGWRGPPPHLRWCVPGCGMVEAAALSSGASEHFLPYDAS